MPRTGRKEEILEHASRLFRTKGYHGTTIRDISDASGMLSGSLYAHIQSKEDLLYEITNRGAERFLSSLAPIVAGDDPPEEKVRLALTAHIQVIVDHLEAATVFFHEWKALSKERRLLIQAKRDQYEQMWAQLLAEGERQGRFQMPDAKSARLMLLSVANGVYQWYTPDGEWSAEQVAERFANLLLNGLLTGERSEDQ
jgi:AcrR family transcriptional regulator